MPEKQKQMIKKDTIKKLRAYCKNATIHGVYYFSLNTNFRNKFAWFMILICGIGLNSYLTSMIVNQFVVDPTLTVVETTHYPTTRIPFPAIIVCDSETFYEPNSVDVRTILENRGYNSSLVTAFFKSFADLENYNETDRTRHSFVKKMHGLLHDLGLPFFSLLREFSKPCSVLLKECIWRSQKIDCGEMFRKVLNYKGFCCRFDVETFRKSAKNGTVFRVHPNKNKALQIILNGNKIHNGTLKSGNVEMIVIDEKDTVSIMDTSVTLAPNTYYDVKIDVWAIDASDNVKALSEEVRKCTLPTDNDEHKTKSYTSCISSLAMSEIVNTCRCIPYFDRSSLRNETLMTYPNCTWERYKCIMTTKSNFAGSALELKAFKQCFQKCEYAQYDTSVEYVELTRVQDSHSEEFNRKLDANYSIISIYYSDRTCLKYRREVLYTWDQMLANVGGIFGLCLGGSIISILELIWLLVDLISVYIRNKYKCNNKITSLEDRLKNNVFFVDNNFK